MTDLQDAPITEEKIIGKKLTLFIFSPRSGRVNRKHLYKLLFGRKEYRAFRRRVWKGYSYKGTVTEKEGSVEYEYKGLLSEIFHWCPFSNKSIFFVERKNAEKVSKFFDELGISYVQGNVVMTKLKI